MIYYIFNSNDIQDVNTRVQFQNAVLQLQYRRDRRVNSNNDRMIIIKRVTEIFSLLITCQQY